MRDVAIVLALTGTGLAVARALRGSGMVVIGVDNDAWRPGVWSRDLRWVGGLSELPLGEPLVDAIVAFARRERCRPVLVPAADDAIEWLLAHRVALGRCCTFSAGYVDARAGVLLDKLRFAAGCSELGIDVPLTVLPESRADVDAFVRQAGLPCIVKPRSGHKWRQRLRGQKLLVPQTEAEMHRMLDEIVGDPSAVVLQELIPGDEAEITVGAVWVGEQGDLRSMLTARKMRQFPRDFGSGSWVRTEPLPEIARLSAEVVAALDVRGLCGTEFKRDRRTGRHRLIEINPRPTLWYDLCRAAGVELVRGHVEELRDGTRWPIAPQRDGVSWRYWTRDVIAMGQASGGLRGLPGWLGQEWATPHADTEATMSLRDPTTIVASVAHTGWQAVTHLLRRGGAD